MEALYDIENTLRFRWLRQQDAGGSNRQRKIEAIAQSIGEKKLGYGEETVAFRCPENRLRIALGTNNHVVL